MKVNYLFVWMMLLTVSVGLTGCLDETEMKPPTFRYVCDIEEYGTGYLLETDWNDRLFAQNLPADYEDFESGQRVVATFTDLKEVNEVG